MFNVIIKISKIISKQQCVYNLTAEFVNSLYTPTSCTVQFISLFIHKNYLSVLNSVPFNICRKYVFFRLHKNKLYGTLTYSSIFIFYIVFINLCEMFKM